jgi:23S rRNA (guanine2445-N2)-methyltransferase / 23S rRNA (guanine2069-N7)-methyltransferase
LRRADCTEWLAQAQRDGRRYGLIFLDPPTFSNSKFMEDNFDVQRDHVALIRGAVALLEPDGVLIFSNNFRRFKLDTEALADLAIEDISAATLPPDFERNPKIHRCWKIGPKR